MLDDLSTIFYNIVYIYIYAQSMRLLFVANVCGMDDSRLTIANHSGPTQKKNKKFRFDEFVLSVCRKALPGSIWYVYVRIPSLVLGNFVVNLLEPGFTDSKSAVLTTVL